MIDMLIKKNKLTSNKYEKCASCGESTEYTQDTPIDKRVGYIQGAGQLCQKCYKELYPKGEIGFD